MKYLTVTFSENFFAHYISTTQVATIKYVGVEIARLVHSLIWPNIVLPYLTFALYQKEQC